MHRDFERFAAEGIPGEKTRLYRSVNRRDENKIREELTIRLIKDKPSMTKLNATLTSVAMQSNSRAESKWLFDFDVDDLAILLQFYNDLPVGGTIYKTPNGYAIVVDHGFDTRELIKKWENYDITLKRDELLFLDMKEA